MKVSFTRKVLSVVLLCSFAEVAALPIGAEPLQRARRSAAHEVWERTELYFGAGGPEGGSVSEEEFGHFIDDEVTPRFPDGLTELQGFGQWRDARGVIGKEHSIVLILLYKDRTIATDAKITLIREAYKTRFHHQSVLRVDSKAEVSF
ncbi:hypothetical protein AciPR4_3396 [Terriglobus saanensis SP1PR4]|uniref:Lipoprotein n=2 Tax=Terriglobus saanensis TaxID=870903 RepID=E8UXC6_TERSS|nr:hypothetical protein AciPR4_3396 [Terriglobus saanensis SP1PR4]